ncbi:MAG: PIG-L family deacetylase [Candidatus Kapabacteria bacterium]|nr:PIG-L family deacetylase [Candidatus Kapabacteria bacterium]
MRTFISIAIGCVFLISASAQPIRPLTSARIYGEMQRLRSLTSVLYVAAHPDDENTRLLSWLATGRHIRTAYLSITRGDGGQNIIGSEQGAALGLIRTYELLEARKLDGAGQYFARAVDFGFSKNPEETFRQWDSIVLIADAVRTIRQFRPDVVICRFPKDSMAGHGQHSASAIIAEHAVAFCNGTLSLSQWDKSRLDVLLEGTTPWKPTRLLFNAFRFGNRSTVREGMFKLEVGQYDPLIGMGYGELAGISRSIHRSQGAGTPSTPGVQPEFFATLWGPEPRVSLFDNIDTTWQRVGRADIGTAIDDVISSYDMLHPERSLIALLRIRSMIRTVNDVEWRSLKLAEIESIIGSCMGLSAEVTTSTAIAVVGDSLRTTLRITTRAGRTVQLVSARWPDGALRENIALPQDSLVTIDVATLVPQSVPIVQPYWLATESSKSLFTFTTNTPLNKRIEPTLESAYGVTVMIGVDSDTISMRLPICFKKLEPLRGDMIEAMRIVPPVSIEPTQLVETSPNARVRVRAYKPVTNARLVISGENGAQPTVASDISMRANTDTLITIPLPKNAGTRLRVGFDVNGVIYTRQVKAITYDHLPTVQYTTPAQIYVPDSRGVQITAKRIAYVAGAGEYAPEFLRGLGVTVDEIDDAMILRTDELLTYDAVLVGIRAINVHKSMQYLMPALLTYVERGGTLVMQYNTTQDMSTKQLGPYPLPLTSKRVTEEDAEVVVLKPEHALLNTPNKILPEDFNGWVQERGLYFPSEYDERYESILSMHDVKEQPLTGSLLYAKVGKGHYISCSLSLFRELPAGVSGAMRLFANLVSMK